MKKNVLYLLMLTLPIFVKAQQAIHQISSPNKQVTVKVFLTKAGALQYSVANNGRAVIMPSDLGIETQSSNFTQGLAITGVSAVKNIAENYSLKTGKKENARYQALERTVSVKNKQGKTLQVVFRVSNDGLAFRYLFPKTEKGPITVTKELTSYTFNQQTRAFIQPMSVAQTGWEHTNPSYEEHYAQNIPVGTPSTLGAGWVYPALFESGADWVLITEAGMDGSYCGTRLHNDSGSATYKVQFPDPREVFTNGSLLPQLKGGMGSPWRLVTIGPLKTMVESTHGTDLAAPAKAMDWSFVKPGKASWSWIMSKDDSIVYNEQKRYIDFAADMHWQYCLIDVNWNFKIGYDKIKELSDYAAAKKVGLILWYNSSGAWNTTKYQPKGMLLTREARQKEFARIQKMGIKGVKIDFFAGDGSSMMQYYIDILEDAAKYHLLVNFHGATLPRGWSRTYPHLVTTEAVKGFEMVTFEQFGADVQANHCAMLPFTRNAFDPMDFTPMNLYKIESHVKRKTTSAFELATSVLFLSGIQHYAESPTGMSHQPEAVKNFLRQLPNTWQETRFIEGYPGKYAIIARRQGKQWYIAAINGTKEKKQIMLNLASFKKQTATLFTEGANELTIANQQLALPKNGKLTIDLNANGGFVIIL